VKNNFYTYWKKRTRSINKIWKRWKYIEWKKVYFQRKNTVTFEIIKLLFLYFQENNKNQVLFYELEEYYKNNKSLYTELHKVRFNYDYLRKSIGIKSKAIEEKHNLNKKFLGIDTSWIVCQYLISENK